MIFVEHNMTWTVEHTLFAAGDSLGKGRLPYVVMPVTSATPAGKEQ